jgi:hypothetical protein
VEWAEGQEKIPLSEMENGLFTKRQWGRGYLEVMDIAFLSKWLQKIFNGKG